MDNCSVKVLITGGCGFIGSHLCEYYLKNGHEVLTVDNLSSGRLENIAEFTSNPSFRFEIADVRTWSTLGQSIDWADVIFHFAATVGMFNVVHDPISVLMNNVVGCQRILDLMANIKSHATIVIASSSSVYGDGTKCSLQEEDNLIVHPLSNSMSTYPISKLADEALGYAYLNRYKMNILFARMFNTIGPRQTGLYGMVVPRFVKQACANQPITIFGDGTQTRSFCDVRDVIRALDMLIQEPRALGQSINIGNSVEISINDLAHLVKTQAGSSSILQYIPYEVYGSNFVDVNQRCPNLEKLHNLIPFKHEWTLTDTIQQLITKERQLSKKAAEV